MSSLFAFKIVYYSNPFFYFSISIIVFASLWILFNFMDQLLFFSPVFYFYIPTDAIIGFVLTSISGLLLGLTVPLNVYLLRNTSTGLDKSLVSSSFLAIITGACASCSSVGFLIISTFGGVGIITTAFLTNYQIPLRLLSIGIMVLALYTACHKITKGCKLDNGGFGNKTK